MADTLNKPKLQSVISVNGGSNKTPPSPAAKLMLNHGKPNFTIQRSPKVHENGDNANPLSPQANGNNSNYNAFRSANKSNDIVVQSTKFNGVFKPSNIAINDKQPHQQQSSENEAAKVVLRRPKVAEEPMREGEDENVPEFIRRQRRIQERLAKENVLDFENRRSGYFTHVMISPSSPNRTSFVETMSSPATIAALEIPPSSPQTPATVVEEDERSVSVESESEPTAVLTNGTTNGHAAEEEEEVAKAIEEVNKAVAGEDDNISEDVEAVVMATPAVAIFEEEVKQNVDEIVAVAVATTLELIDTPQTPAAAEENTETAGVPPEVALAVAAVTVLENIEEVQSAPVENGIAEEVKLNGHATTNGNDDVTISHTNGSDNPCIPSPDPSGALGVNYEPKTVVSFSKDLGEPNKYPDTVKVVREDGTDETVKTLVDAELQEMAKLKFDIKADELDVQVTPVLRAE